MDMLTRMAAHKDEQQAKKYKIALYTLLAVNRRNKHL
jgi:hypothetical protein